MFTFKFPEQANKFTFKDLIFTFVIHSFLSYMFDVECFHFLRKRNANTFVSFAHIAQNFSVTGALTRLLCKPTCSRWQIDKEATGLLRIEQFDHLCPPLPDIFKFYFLTYSHY